MSKPRLILPENVINEFMSIASTNICNEDGKHLETLAFAAGHLENDYLKITDIIFPRQLSTPFSVEDRGKKL